MQENMAIQFNVCKQSVSLSSRASICLPISLVKMKDGFWKGLASEGGTEIRFFQ